MHKRKLRFIEIMRIELEDLHDDIDSILEHCVQLFREHEITEFGYFGNLSVLKGELHGVGVFARMLNNVDTAKYDTVEAMAEDLERQLLAEIEKYGMVPAIDILIRRKIEKVMKYV